jgi:hypothetical protein
MCRHWLFDTFGLIYCLTLLPCRDSYAFFYKHGKAGFCDCYAVTLPMAGDDKAVARAQAVPVS